MIVPARVVSVAGEIAQLRLPDGSVASVNITLVPEVRVDQYVLFDRGVALKVIEAEEAEAILALYAELVELAS